MHSSAVVVDHDLRVLGQLPPSLRGSSSGTPAPPLPQHPDELEWQTRKHLVPGELAGNVDAFRAGREAKGGPARVVG